MGNYLEPNNNALPPTYNPYVVEKKNQVLDQIAKQKKATKEAKGRAMRTAYLTRQTRLSKHNPCNLDLSTLLG